MEPKPLGLTGVLAFIVGISALEAFGAEITPQYVTNAPGSEIILTAPPGSSSTYQWLKNGFFVRDSDHIQGAQTPMLHIFHSFSLDEGTYTLTSGSEVVQTNAIYILRVETLTGSYTIPPGGVIRLSGGQGGAFYQWYKDGVLLEDTWDTDRISGSKTANLTIKGALESDSGAYALECMAGLIMEPQVVTNASYTVQVIEAPPSVPPAISRFTMFYGANYVRFDVEATGSAPLFYQWSWQGQDIPGATDNSLTYDPAETTANAGYYSVRVWNQFGQVSTPPPGLLLLKATPAGNYQGIFYNETDPTPETSGAFQFTLSQSTRSFSGKVLMGKTAHRFSGTLSEAHDTVVKTLKSANPLTLSLQLLTTNDMPSVVGTIGNSSWSVALRGYRAGYGSKNLAPQAGKYTLALQNQSTNIVRTVPDGCSFGSVVVSKYGGITMSGLAADGTTISHASSISKQGDWPLYISLYKNQGCIVGWLRLTNTTETAIEGQRVNWVKNGVPGSSSYPAGFSSKLQAIGSTFNAAPNQGPWPPPPVVDVLSFSEAVASLAAGDLFSSTSSWIFVKVTVPAPNTLSAEPGPEKLKLSVSRTTGTISGSFINPTNNRRVPIRGKVLQDHNSALGYFLSGGLSGFFSLTPPQQGDQGQ